MASQSFEYAAESLVVQQHVQDTEHCHNHDNDYHQDQCVDQDANTHHGCNHCQHCLACFSVIPQAQLAAMSIKPNMILSVLFAQIYLSPITIQPQKPPIV